MLRVRPVEVGVRALDVRAVELLALGGDRREQSLLPGRAPALGCAEDPLDLLVAADLDAGGLMARGDDDGVVTRS